MTSAAITAGPVTSSAACCTSAVHSLSPSIVIGQVTLDASPACTPYVVAAAARSAVLQQSGRSSRLLREVASRSVRRYLPFGPLTT